jgi:hypothetical protein
MARALPDDVGGLSWLAGVLGVADSTCYRLASTGELDVFGVFRVGSQYRVSKPKALRAIHGLDSEAAPEAS